MKIFTLLMAGMVAVSASAAVTPAKKAHYVGQDSNRKLAAKELVGKPELMKAAVAESPVWRNTELSIQEYMLDMQEWDVEEKHLISYDKQGNPLTDLMLVKEYDVKSRSTMTYNEDGMLATKLDEDGGEDDEWFPYNNRINTYDNVVKNYIVKKEDFYYDESNPANPWVPTMYAFFKDITRDAKGRVSGIAISPWFNNQWSPVHKYEVKYDESIGVPSEIVHNELTYNMEWELTEKYSNITWDRTDNQILDTQMTDCFLMGNNRIKRALINMDGMDYVVSVTYTGEKDFVAVTTSDEDKETHKYETLDANGSYRESFVNEMDMDGDGVITDEERYFEERVVRYDEGGRLTENSEYMLDELMGSEKITYTLDPKTGCPVEEITEAWFMADPTIGIDEDGYYPVMKVTKSGYIDVTKSEGGVEGVGADAMTVKVLADAVEVSLNGMTSYSVYALNGAAVASGNLCGTTATIATGDLANGVYMLRINTANGAKVVKFAK